MPKKIEKIEVPALPDASAMHLYEKLLNIRVDFYAQGAKKTGKNLHAEFKYFELEDIVPIATPLFVRYRVLLLMTFSADSATARLVNLDDVQEVIEFQIPLVFISEPAKFRMNETQGAGAVVTYYRRYLYQIVLDIVETDEIDNRMARSVPAKTEQTVALRNAPATPQQRKEIAKTLTDADDPADELQIEGLKDALVTLLDADPSQEEWVQDVAVRTENFSTLSRSVCDALIAAVRDMLATLGVAQEK